MSTPRKHKIKEKLRDIALRSLRTRSVSHRNPHDVVVCTYCNEGELRELLALGCRFAKKDPHRDPAIRQARYPSWSNRLSHTFEYVPPEIKVTAMRRMEYFKERYKKQMESMKAEIKAQRQRVADKAYVRSLR